MPTHPPAVNVVNGAGAVWRMGPMWEVRGVLKEGVCGFLNGNALDSFMIPPDVAGFGEPA